MKIVIRGKTSFLVIRTGRNEEKSAPEDKRGKTQKKLKANGIYGTKAVQE